MSETNRVPSYGDKPNAPGLYLGLLHGRDAPTDQPQEWGYNGPLIGPLKYVHTTYASTVRIEFEDIEHARQYGFEEVDQMFDLHEDLFVFQGKYYGDWTVSRFDGKTEGQ